MSKFVPNRLIRRILMGLISAALGYGIMLAIIASPIVDTTLQEYTWGPEHPIPLPYAFLTALFIALGIAVWLDKFMETEFLPH